jgi:uncharacterized metal-binding protein
MFKADERSEPRACSSGRWSAMPFLLSSTKDLTRHRAAERTWLSQTMLRNLAVSLDKAVLTCNREFGKTYGGEWRHCGGG